MHEIGRFYERRKNKLCLNGSCDLHYLECDFMTLILTIIDLIKSEKQLQSHQLTFCERVSHRWWRAVGVSTTVRCAFGARWTHTTCHSPSHSGSLCQLPVRVIDWLIRLPSWVWLGLSGACASAARFEMALATAAVNRRWVWDDCLRVAFLLSVSQMMRNRGGSETRIFFRNGNEF